MNVDNISFCFEQWWFVCVCVWGEALILIVLISDLNILTVLHQLFKKLELLSIKAIQENEKLEA